MTAAALAAPTLIERLVRPDAPFDIAFPELAADAVLCVGLTISPHHADALHASAQRHTLAEEHARAARFLRAEDGLRNLAGRMLLRVLAAHYGGMPPDQPISLNPWGKPDLSPYGIGCNISHAGTQVWAAVARFPRLGIDVESALAPPDFRELSAGFHPDEIAMLKQAPDASAATIRCWTRKEAVAKATGMGLSLPLHAYAVDCGTPASGWLRVAPAGSAPDAWSTADLPLTGDYVGALAVEGRCSAIQILRLAVG